MVPQVLATLHLLFTDEQRNRAFAVYGIVLGLAGAAGFLLGGLLVTIDLAGTGWRSVFFVNVPCGLVIAAVAWRIMPSAPHRAGTRLDITGSIVLFAGLLCMIGPLLFGHDVGWAPWLWLVMAIGAVILLAFPKLEHAVARAGGMPLIDLSLLADAAFLRGLGAAFFFFSANLSFYLVMTLFMQRGLKIPPLAAGMAFIPLALAFVVASRHSGARARHRGTRVLIEGCALQIAGLTALALVAFSVDAPSALLLALTMIVVRLRSGAGDGTALRRGALDGEARGRRFCLRHVRHHGADRKCGRSGRNRRGVLRRRSRAIGARRISRLARAVCDINHDLRRIPGVDAPCICTELRHCG